MIALKASPPSSDAAPKPAKTWASGGETLPYGFLVLCGAVIALLALLLWSSHQLTRSLERERLTASIFSLNLAASDELDRLQSTLLQFDDKRGLEAMALQLGQDFPFLIELEVDGGAIWRSSRFARRSPIDSERHKYAMLILSERLRKSSQGLVISLPQTNLSGTTELVLSWILGSGAGQTRAYASVAIDELLKSSIIQSPDGQRLEIETTTRNLEVGSVASQRVLLAGMEIPLEVRPRKNVGGVIAFSWEQVLVPLAVLVGVLALFLCWRVFLETKARLEGEARLRDQEERIRRNAGLATLGEIATLVSHEINQPLAAMEVYASTCLRLLRQPAQESDGARGGLIGAVESIRQEVGRVGRIISSIKGLTERQGTIASYCDLSQAIQQIEPLVLMQAKRYRMRVEFSIDRRVRVVCDPSSVEQVLLNLIRNGLEAMENESGERRTLRVVGEALDEDWAQVQVIDRGPGISPEIESRIFSPFFSTKSSGTGVGLSLCHSLIEKNGGRIWFESTAGSGTNFKFTLPRSTEVSL